VGWGEVEAGGKKGRGEEVKGCICTQQEVERRGFHR
jgi:hypothetical protein